MASTILIIIAGLIWLGASVSPIGSAQERWMIDAAKLSLLLAIALK